MYNNYFNSRIENTLSDSLTKKKLNLSTKKKRKKEVIKSDTPNLIMKIQHNSK